MRKLDKLPDGIRGMSETYLEMKRPSPPEPAPSTVQNTFGSVQGNPQRKGRRSKKLWFIPLAMITILALGAGGFLYARDYLGTDMNSESSATAASSRDAPDTVAAASPGAMQLVTSGVCEGVNDMTNVPAAYKAAMKKYATTNAQYLVTVCTEDEDGNGIDDYIVVESTNQPEHKSAYYEPSHVHNEAYDYETNVHKYAAVHADQTAGPAGSNTIQPQTITMRIPMQPSQAAIKTATTYDTIGLALNGVSFFNEQAGPDDDITNELFTFDQCSGHPQQSGVYHYHADPVCLIRDLGGAVATGAASAEDATYTWIEDTGTNAGLLLGFLIDGFPVYGPIGSGGESDCNAAAVNVAIDAYNGHLHCTEEFSDPVYHYHVKTAVAGGASTPVFWISNAEYYGTPGSVTNGLSAANNQPAQGASPR